VPVETAAAPVARLLPVVSVRRVVVADDDLLLREGLASLLARSGYEIVGQTGSARELLALAREHEPDLVIVDIRMPHSTEGLDAAMVIREELPQTAILVLSGYLEVQAMDLLRSGPRSGYLLKGRVLHVDVFLETLADVLNGGPIIEPALVQELVARRRAQGPHGVLSPREHDVLELMAAGRSNAGIAQRLGLAKATVERYVHSILVKLVPLETQDEHRRIRAVLTFLEER
jgi:DNA-binding NarL/FixJ family response regulator